MKTSKTLLTTMAASIVCSLSAYAEDGDKKAKRPDRKGPPKELIKKFDKDNDGQLSEAERSEMKAAMEKRREEGKAKMLERFDTDKDGKLSEDERKAARDAMSKKREEVKKAVLAQFDKNNNGKLDEDEREGVREWVQQNYPDARPPHRKHKQGKGKRPGKNGNDKAPGAKKRGAANE